MTITPAAASALAKGDMENFLVAATPGGIEAQEAAGQAALLQTTNMPLELRPAKEVWEAVGFTFGEKLDDVFQAATLPRGWVREGSDHAMWSYIKDEQGRRRASVFYKAAFYDRNASASLDRRIQPDNHYPSDRSLPVEIGVSDCGVMIFKAGEEMRDDYNRERREAMDKAVQDYLAANYPNWNDPTAYW